MRGRRRAAGTRRRPGRGAVRAPRRLRRGGRGGRRPADRLRAEREALLRARPRRRLRRELRAAWRPLLVGWFLPAPLLVAFLYVFQTAPGLALAFAAGLLLVAAWANRFRRRLERTLAGERSRARVDALTNAPNRYALAEALAAEQARIRRGGRTAALCFLDLDRFKSVNDTYGYAAGDRLLVDVHERLRGELRASDLVFRWGGEEFVVLAPHVERAELADFAERLRLLLATRPFAIDGRPRTITGSVGAVLLDESRPAAGRARGGEPAGQEGEADAQCRRGRRTAPGAAA